MKRLFKFRTIFYVPAGSPKGPCDLDVRGAGAIPIERLMPLLEFFDDLNFK